MEKQSQASALLDQDQQTGQGLTQPPPPYTHNITLVLLSEEEQGKVLNDISPLEPVKEEK